MARIAGNQSEQPLGPFRSYSTMRGLQCTFWMAHRVNGTSTNHQVPPVLLLFQVLVDFSHTAGGPKSKTSLYHLRPWKFHPTSRIVQDKCLGKLNVPVKSKDPKVLGRGMFYDSRLMAIANCQIALKLQSKTSIVGTKPSNRHVFRLVDFTTSTTMLQSFSA